MSEQQHTILFGRQDQDTIRRNRSLLWSSNSSDVFVPGTNTKIGDRAFEVSDPRTWNSLPATIGKTKILPAFKKQLKLYLIGNPEH